MNSAIFKPVRSFPLKPLAAAVLLIHAAGVQSAPVFQNSPGGNVTVSRPDTKTTLVTQSGSRAVANWRDFSIEADETVRFAQDNASAVILNRVTGENTSRILGSMQANGRVFLINPNGIVFGSNAQVNVNGLVASTLNLKSGSNSNSQTIGLELEDQAGSITNNGQITAKDILLIAPTIENTGILKAEGSNSTVQLVAASEVTVNTADGNLVFQVEKGFENTLIDQLGTLMAEGGRIILMASATRGGVPSVINIANLNQATQISVQGDSVRLSGNINQAQENTRLEVTAKDITQTAAVNSGGVVVLKANSVDLQIAENDFQGSVNLDINGHARLNDSNRLAVQGSAEDAVFTAGESVAVSALNVSNHLRIDAANQVDLGPLQAGSLTVTTSLVRNANSDSDGAVNVSGATHLTAENVELSNASNDFVGTVNLNRVGRADLLDSNRLNVSGAVNTLGLKADTVVVDELTVQGSLSIAANTIEQQGALIVEGETTLGASAVALLDSTNDFKGNVILNNAGQVALRDMNNLQIQGNGVNLNAHAGNGTLTLGGSGTLEISEGTLRASTIDLNRLNVLNQASMQANSITQSQANSTGGALTLSADSVSLLREGNDFRGEIVLNDVRIADILDSNNLNISGSAGELNVQAGERLVFGSLEVDRLNANARQIDQRNLPGSVVRVNGSTRLSAEQVDLRNTNDFQGGVNLLVAGNVQLRDANTLSLQGSAGELELHAQNLQQSDALVIAGAARLNANHTMFNHSGNDFQGEVVLNNTGNAVVFDENNLNVSGRVNGTTQLTAQRVEQSGALRTGSSLLIQSDTINLGNSGNSLTGGVRIENAVDVNLVSAGNLSVTGSRLETLSLTADEVTLGALGAVQTLGIVADEVNQTAALLVQGQTTLTAGHAVLSHSNNDFVGDVQVQARTSSSPVVEISDANSLIIRGNDLQLGAQVQGDLSVVANNLVFGRTTVLGNSQVVLTGNLTQSDSVSLNNAQLSANRIELNRVGNSFGGTTRIDSSELVALAATGDLNADIGTSSATMMLNIRGNANLQGEHVRFGQSRFTNNLTVNANEISQLGSQALEVQGNTQLEAAGGSISLENSNNRFSGFVSATAEQTSIAASQDLQLLNLSSRGGEISAGGHLLLLGNIEQLGGTLTFSAQGIPSPLSSAEIELMLPPALDVFSSKEAVNPITGLGRITLASPVIEQTSGQITTTATSLTRFNSLQNGSVVLTRNNAIGGQVSALSGERFGQTFAYLPNRGASLFAVNNDAKLQVGAQGVEADVVAIRARGLATQGENSVIRSRMPYNDIAAGAARSYAGLTLSIPLSVNTGPRGVSTATFGESSVSSSSGGSGAIRVDVGDSSRPGLGGFLTVLPFEGTNLLPGQVVYLTGPEGNGTKAFFYDGARNLNRVPVVYNGSFLLSPQESAALTTAQGAVVLARQEQTRSVVRTENVAGKIINGVVLEVGPGRPATEGAGGAGKPASCDAADSGLACNP